MPSASPPGLRTPASDAARRGRQGGLIVLFTGALVALLWGIGARPFDLADVLRYAQMAFEMRHGHTLIPTLEGQPYFGAMPLPAWGALAVSAWTGAVTPGAARLLSGLAALATVLVVTAFAWRRVSPAVGLLAGAACALSPLTIAYGRSSRIDVTLGLGVTIAVLAAFLAVRSEATPRARRLAAVVAGLGLALAVAAKGPAAVILIGAALLPWLAFERRLRAALTPAAVATVVGVVLTALWFTPYARVLGAAGTRAFLDQFLLNETVSKVEGDYGKLEPFWSYAAQFLPKLAPWSLPALCGLVRVVRRPSRATSVERLAVSWLVVPLLLLSLSAGKHIRYVVPLTPAVALLAACEIRQWVLLAGPRLRRAATVAARVVAVLLGATALGQIAWAVRADGATVGHVWPGLVVALLAANALVASRRGPGVVTAGALYLTACGCVALYYGEYLALPSVVARSSPYSRLAAGIQTVAHVDRPLAVVVRTRRPDVDHLEPAGLDAHELGLFLGSHVETVTPDELPSGDMLLSRLPIEGRPVLSAIDVAPEGERRRRPWLLLGPTAR